MSEKNIVDLRDVLWREIEDLKKGNTTVDKATVIIKAADAIINSVKLELTYAALLHSAGVKKFNIPILTAKERTSALERPKEEERVSGEVGEKQSEEDKWSKGEE